MLDTRHKVHETKKIEIGSEKKNGSKLFGVSKRQTSGIAS